MMKMILILITGVFFLGQDILSEEGNAGLITVVMTDGLKFVPRHAVIKSGQTVIWKNNSRIVHTVTAKTSLAAKPENAEIPHGSKPFNSGAIPPGQTFVHTFTLPGVYHYFCIPHEMAGMTGSVTVKKN